VRELFCVGCNQPVAVAALHLQILFFIRRIEMIVLNAFCHFSPIQRQVWHRVRRVTSNLHCDRFTAIPCPNAKSATKETFGQRVTHRPPWY
jgi:hypothetical protein